MIGNDQYFTRFAAAAEDGGRRVATLDKRCQSVEARANRVIEIEPEIKFQGRWGVFTEAGLREAPWEGGGNMRHGG